MIVRESIMDEGMDFQRGLDPKKSLNVGLKTQLTNDLEKLGYQENTNFKFDEEGDLVWNANRHPNEVLTLLKKYMSSAKYSFMSDLVISNKGVQQIVDEGIKNGLTIKDMQKLVDAYGEDALKFFKEKSHLENLKIYLHKYARTQEEIDFDEEHNVYIFIGFMDKKPVTINNKKYYEDKFEAEVMLKIDQFNASDLAQVTGMKIRAHQQYPDGAVYMVRIPKFMMDEDRYDGIPEEWQEIVEKYKKKIA